MAPKKYCMVSVRHGGWCSITIGAFSGSKVATGTYFCAITDKVGTSYVPVQVK